ncbi:MAG: DUF3108 domain-containing protein [Nitrospirota bacterium]
MDFKKFLKRCGIVVLMFIFMVVTLNLGAASISVPEKFVYDLRWMGVKAGKACLEVRNEKDKIKIVSSAHSADWVSVFYTVDDRIESTLFKEFPVLRVGQPLKYSVKIREGRHRRNKEVLFDHEKRKATHVDHIKNETKEYNLPSYVFDPISGFYYIRTLKLSVGESAFVKIFDSKKVWNVEVQVLRKEKVTLPMGTFDTVVVKPLMKSEGIFFAKGDIYIWLTDDARHIPVKLQTKVAVGNITATLVEGYY